MNKHVLTMALLLGASGAFAQNKLVRKAQTLYDEGKFAEAQAELTTALTSGETKNMAQAWDLQGNIYQRLFADELNKAAAKQPMDTAVFAKNLSLCLQAYDKCNEYDEKKEFLTKNQGNVKKFRTFLMYAAQFGFQNKDFKMAYDSYDSWLNFPKTCKLVAGDPTVENDTTFEKAQVAYYACLAAYQGKMFDKVGTHIEEALNYKKEEKTVRQLQLMTLQETGDTAQWIEVSKKYAKDDEAVAQNLLAYYSEKKDDAASLAFVDELLAADPNNKIANYSKGVVFFGQQKFKEAMPLFEKASQIDPTFADAFYNAGVCCCNVGYAINEEVGKKKYKTQAAYNKDIEQVKVWYKKAEPFFKKVQELLPDQPERWASRLKTVYYITGEKAKEKEMDAFLQ